VRALARSLAKDIRSAVDRIGEDGHGGQGTEAGDPLSRGPGSGFDAGSGSGSRERRSAREDFADAARAARREYRRAQRAFRGRHGQRYYPQDPTRGSDEGADDTGSSPGGPGGGGPPRWDNYGRHPHRHHEWAGSGPSSRAPLPVMVRERPPKPAKVPKPAPVPAPPVRHRRDGSTLLGLLAVVFGLAWLATGTHVAHVSTVAVVAVALMVVGAAMVVTARTDWALSRRTWPVLGGAVLAATLLAFSVSPNLPVGFQHLSVGSRTITPATWAAVPATVHGGFGRTAIDLTGLPGQPPVPRTVAVDNAAGQILITLPATLKVVVNAAVSAGQININGQFLSGLGRSEVLTLNPGTAGPALTLKVQSGFGDTVITQLPTDAVTGASAPVAPAAP